MPFPQIVPQNVIVPRKKEKDIPWLKGRVAGNHGVDPNIFIFNHIYIY
jgi:hypothetical protein